jgi:exodeoxyribonuclease VII large subunit
MQGPGAISEIPTKISQINKNQYDCVVIIRGGGAKLDLIDFDHYEIAKQISNCNFPVLTGIGHQQDESIADLNAYESLKTPTAVADYIVEHNMKFENLIFNHFQTIVEQIQLITHKKSEKHSALINQIKLSAHQWLTNKKNARTGIYHNLKEYSTNKLHQLKISLLEHTHTLSNNDPLEILKKGYAITYQNSKKIKNIKQLKENEPIEIVYIDGQAFGAIQSKTNYKND